MECKVCHNQDMKMEMKTPKTGRNAGTPCRVYSCTTPNCLNDKGYPNSVWVAVKNGPQNASNAKPGVLPGAISTLEKKVDQILAILKAEFPSAIEVHEPEEESTPF